MELPNLRWVNTDGAVPKIFQTEFTPIQGATIQEAIADDYLYWKPKHPVFIDAPTGVGKTTFIYNQIIPYAISKGQNVLIVSNRIALNEQQKQDIVNRFQEYIDWQEIGAEDSNLEEIDCYSIFGPIGVVTYQGLQRFLNYLTSSDEPLYSDWFANLGYSVFDEAHFFYSDALFNANCGRILYSLPKTFKHSVRIYMTATPWQILEEVAQAECVARFEKNTMLKEAGIRYIPNRNESPFYNAQASFNTLVFKYYEMKSTYEQYNLHFFGENSDIPALPIKNPARTMTRKKSLQALITYMNPLPSESNKWIIFVDKKQTGKKLKSILEQMDGENGRKISVAYIDANEKKPKKAWDLLIKSQTFMEDVLIATPVIENGVNIVCNEVKNIAIFCTDRTTFIQELGRKRIKSDEKIDLWVWLPTKMELLKIVTEMSWYISVVSELHTYTRNPEKNEESYISAAHRLWARRENIQYNSLFYINKKGLFDVNNFAYRMLSKRYNFLEPLHNSGLTANFKKEVESWLGIKEIPVIIPERVSPLLSLLQKHEGIDLDSDKFAAIRETIIKEAQENGFKVPEKTPDSKSLNNSLSQLGLPYIVKRRKEEFTIIRK